MIMTQHCAQSWYKQFKVSQGIQYKSPHSIWGNCTLLWQICVAEVNRYLPRHIFKGTVTIMTHTQKNDA